MWQGLGTLIPIILISYICYWQGWNKGFKEGKQNGYAKGISQGIRNSR